MSNSSHLLSKSGSKKLIVLAITVFTILICFSGRVIIGQFFYNIHCLYASTFILEKPNSTVVVSKGDNLYKIIDKLVTEGNLTISSAEKKALYFLNRLSSSKSQIYLTGEYEIKNNSNLNNFLNAVREHKVLYRKITFPEGLMTGEILKEINTASTLSGPEVYDIEEGALMPDTYYYTYGETKADLVRRMSTAMTEYLQKEWRNVSTRPPELRNEYEVLILASIIEKETAVPEERSVVSSVFINRLRKKMRLEASPTVLYKLNVDNIKNQRPLYNTIPSLSFLKLPSSHNTYIIKGLPPTPICNPGKESIKAALNPANTNYLFFVSTDTGGHIFTSDFNAHIKYRHIYNH